MQIENRYRKPIVGWGEEKLAKENVEVTGDRWASVERVEDKWGGGGWRHEARPPL